MKKILLLFIPVAFFLSCNTEMDAEQLRAQANGQCLKQLAKKLLDADATDAEKEAFCDCYADYMVGDSETMTMGEYMKKATKTEELTGALESCAEQAQKDETEVELPSADELEVVTEETEENPAN